jgi:hypothetical protein
MRRDFQPKKRELGAEIRVQGGYPGASARGC